MRHRIGEHRGYVIEVSDRLKDGRRAMYIARAAEDVMTLPPRRLDDSEVLEIGTWAIDSMIKRGKG